MAKKVFRVRMLVMVAMLLVVGLVMTSCGCPHGGCSASNTGATSNCAQSSCSVHQWSQRWQQGDRDGNLPSCNC